MHLMLLNINKTTMIISSMSRSKVSYDKEDEVDIKIVIMISTSTSIIIIMISIIVISFVGGCFCGWCRCIYQTCLSSLGLMELLNFELCKAKGNVRDIKSEEKRRPDKIGRQAASQSVSPANHSVSHLKHTTHCRH